MRHSPRPVEVFRGNHRAAHSDSWLVRIDSVARRPGSPLTCCSPIRASSTVDTSHRGQYAAVPMFPLRRALATPYPMTNGQMIMGNKDSQGGNTKKAGKSLKEKRAAKKLKSADKATGSHIPPTGH